MESIKLAVAELIAISVFASKGDVRYYLNGVAIDRNHLVATNGHILGAVDLDKRSKKFPSVIIPNEAIALFLKTLNAKQKRSTDVRVNILDDMKGELASTLEDGVVIPFRFVDGKFPDWKKTLPKITRSRRHETFDWSYMNMFQKSVRTLCDDNQAMVRLITDGHSGASVTSDNAINFIGVIMPVREGVK